MSKFILHPAAITGVADKYSTETNLLHADEFLNEVNDVAPPLHVSTTFRYPRDPSKLRTESELGLEDATDHVYSRLSSPSTARLEAVLSSHLKGYAIVYSSGLAAFHAALVHFNPRQLSGSLFYHGCHGVADIHTRLTGMKQIPLDCPVEDLNPGDVVHLETPLNPMGSAYDIKYYADRAHSRGAILIVDSTFAPPPLQDPFEQGADVVMHSASKYIGGHSDMLGGVLVTRDLKVRWKLWEERLYLGGVMGNMEAWLGTRSARTLTLRVMRQSENATNVVRWLDEELKKDGVVNKVVEKVVHASLQTEDWVRKQMTGGFGPVFAIEMKSELLAKTLPSKLELFMHATSLGGVESLIEWRSMSDPHCAPTLLRVSIGVENWEDLRNDLLQAFESLAKDTLIEINGKD